jgi:pimeloyl-ACP methyl ester carboxylesterase
MARTIELGGWLPEIAARIGAVLPRGLGPGARRETIETAEGTAHFLTIGSGPPVIFLHGLDGSSRWWTPTLRRLAPHFRCFALDFIDFDRWRERSRISLPRSSAFVAAWLDALGLDHAHVVAHSMGGYAACQLAIERPSLVDRLVLVAPAVFTERPPFIREATQLGPFAWTVTPQFLPVLVGDSLRTGPLRWLRSAVELRRAQPLPLEHIAAPTLLIWGTRDPLVPIGQSPEVQRRIANSRLLPLPGARHVPMYERSEACNNAIARFLQGEEVGQARQADR